ncbi:hypothetical protein ACFPA8_07805 [Streptomyces ovatisporus]|uniref:Holliday junction resolvase n=1 Tax=Streptomyces ovatisporus TaxID=1128682 RepID=A0ABV9A2W3_9ACTN
MSAAKRKGTAWETEIVRYLQEQGLAARRVVQMGRLDQGDIHVEEDWVLEAKNVKSIDLADFVRQALREARNAGREYGAAVVKRRNSNVSNGYVITDLETFARIIKALTR